MYVRTDAYAAISLKRLILYFHKFVLRVTLFFSITYSSIGKIHTHTINELYKDDTPSPCLSRRTCARNLTTRLSDYTYPPITHPT